MAEDRAGEPLVAALWDIVEDWSSAAIQRTREAAMTGPTEVLEAETRLLIAHAAQLRGVIEAHLDGADLSDPAVAVAESGDPADGLARLHEVPLAEVCQECFTMVRLDELEAHDEVCVRHKTIEKMDRMLEDDPESEAEALAGEGDVGSEPEAEAEVGADVPAAEADEPEGLADEPVEPEGLTDEPDEPVDGPEAAADEPGGEPEQSAPDHTCNSADFERPLCDTCGGLHWYCSICGVQRDACRTVAVAG